MDRRFYANSGYQMPNYQQMPSYQQNAQYVPQNTFTPPTIHAEIILIDSVEEVENFNVPPNSTQMFSLRDESKFILKQAFQNGGYDIAVYTKEKPKASEKPEYITRADLEQRLTEIFGPLNAEKGAEKNE
jgi:hypothetical protein